MRAYPFTHVARALQVQEDELAKLDRSAPQDWAARKADLPKLLDLANRWTDNTFTLHKYLQDKNGMDKKEASKMLEMKDDFDYVEVDIR